MKRALCFSVLSLVCCLALANCKKAEKASPAAEPSAAPAAADDEKAAEAPAAETDENAKHEGYATEDKQGVDLTGKQINIGALNAESGPAAVIGKPFAVGKRLAYSMANDGTLDILPEGWALNLVEIDHAYNPQKAVQGYTEMKNRVLFIATSFGTPCTLPLRPHLKRDRMVAFPASLSSQMAEDALTPPTGPSYAMEAMRAMDWAVEKAGGADKVKAGIVYQQDDYGKDGLDGWKRAAAHHKVEIVSEQTVTPGQKDMTAVVTALQKAGANYILLTVLPSASGPILGTAFQLKYMPTWVGNTPAWIDAFFSGKVLPTPVMANFHWVSGLPFWGEDLPGMKKFVTAFEKFSAGKIQPDFYILISYIQGLIELEALRMVFDAPEQLITRDTFITALSQIQNWNAGGLIQPIDLSMVPYVTGTRTRILKPDFEKKSWNVVADYAQPKGYNAAPPAPKAAAKPEPAAVEAKPDAGAAKKAATGDTAAPAPSDQGSADKGTKAGAQDAKPPASATGTEKGGAGSEAK